VIAQDDTSGTMEHPEPPLSESDWQGLHARLVRSRFRSRFHLRGKERAYWLAKGEDTIRRHAEDFVRQRLAPAHPRNDGKQTPTRGHPVFIAQHATGLCCRSCAAKWHGIAPGQALADRQLAYVVAVIMRWLKTEEERQEAR